MKCDHRLGSLTEETGFDCEEGDTTSHRIFQNKQNTQIKELYRCFLKEQSTAFTTSTHPDIGCHRCDRRVSDFGNLTALRAYQLDKQITFQVNAETGKGHFVYDRQHLPSVACMPSGISMCASRLTRTAAALQRLPHSLAYLNYSLATDHLDHKTRWLRDIPANLRSNLQIVTTPITLVRNLKSNSTLIRRCNSANVKLPSLCGDMCPCHQIKRKDGEEEKKCQIRLSVNDTIPSFQCTLPQISTLALAGRIAVIASGGDILRFFTNVKQSLKASCLNALVLFRCNKTNFPSFSPTTDGVPNTREILTCTSNYFGISDLSQACGAAAAKAVAVYKAHLSEAGATKRACDTLQRVGIAGDWLLSDS